MKDLLLVIDMQKVYEEGEPWACRGVGRVSQNILRLLGSGRAQETIFTRFDAVADPVGAWADYNREFADVNADPRLAQIVDALAQAAAQYPVYTKHTYSSRRPGRPGGGHRRGGRMLHPLHRGGADRRRHQGGLPHRRGGRPDRRV